MKEAMRGGTHSSLTTFCDVQFSVAAVPSPRTQVLVHQDAKVLSSTANSAGQGGSCPWQVVCREAGLQEISPRAAPQSQQCWPLLPGQGSS